MKNYLEEITKEIILNGDNEKVHNKEIEALNHYANIISRSLVPLPLGDVPYVIGALKSMADNFGKAYPEAVVYADSLLSTVNPEGTFIQTSNKEACDLIEKLLRGIK